jgi:hypothetical protein
VIRFFATTHNLAGIVQHFIKACFCEYLHLYVSFGGKFFSLNIYAKKSAWKWKYRGRRNLVFTLFSLLSRKCYALSAFAKIKKNCAIHYTSYLYIFEQVFLGGGDREGYRQWGHCILFSVSEPVFVNVSGGI